MKRLNWNTLLALAGVLAAIGLLLIAQGCRNATPTTTPTATPTVATPTPTSVATALPVTATPAATPTSAPTPTAEPTNINPLTGLPVEDPAALERVPLAIKVSNSKETRPQSGLQAADLVFEHITEGRITRFTAIFYGNTPERVGSVRSGRLIDLEIPAMYQAMFAYSGSSAGVAVRYKNSDLYPAQIVPDLGKPYFYRMSIPNVAVEHTLFADPKALWELAAQRGLGKPTYTQRMSFDVNPPAGGTPASFINVAYLPTYCPAGWSYDAARGVWLRSIAGEPHKDALTREQIHAANVIVLFAEHHETDIIEDAFNHRSIEMKLIGSGDLLLFRDGQMYRGRWTRAQRSDMLTFTDPQGNPLPLKPGNTWFEVVPLEAKLNEGKTAGEFEVSW